MFERDDAHRRREIDVGAAADEMRFEQFAAAEGEDVAPRETDHRGPKCTLGRKARDGGKQPVEAPGLGEHPQKIRDDGHAHPEPARPFQRLAGKVRVDVAEDPPERGHGGREHHDTQNGFTHRVLSRLAVRAWTTIDPG